MEDWVSMGHFLIFRTTCHVSSPQSSAPVPRNWPTSVRSAILHVISLGQYAIAYTRAWAVDSTNTRLSLKAKLDRANQEIALLREELRIKDARMKHLPPHQRPHYPRSNVWRFSNSKQPAIGRWPKQLGRSSLPRPPFPAGCAGSMKKAPMRWCNCSSPSIAFPNLLPIWFNG